jgi:hypothetical protein
VSGTAQSAAAELERRWPGSCCGSPTNVRVLLERIEGGLCEIDLDPWVIRSVTVGS